MNKIEILNCRYDTLNFQETLNWAKKWIRSGRRGYIATVNVAISMMMYSDPKLQEYVDNASLVVADGQPIIWSSKLFHPCLPERVTGVDLVDGLCAIANQENFRVFLLGAQTDVIKIVVNKFQKKYPQLKICGSHDGYFHPDEVHQIVETIKEKNTQILIIGMGVPRQENFIKNNLKESGINLAIGVGGSFQVIAGRKKRAPFWMQEAGLEWLYRLIQEPRRLWKRYLVTNSQFIYRLSIFIPQKMCRHIWKRLRYQYLLRFQSKQ
ncbi:MAG: WecB/TagA/CpsF family glycosyltransferase [Cyanobacteria bacterium P01_A01_bin.45]